jgi:(S)-2-hydroxyglutarate dehydrogenase
MEIMTHPSLIVIGGGLLGLACARSYQQHHPTAKVIVLEKEHSVCLHQSGSNSGVIHSGIYYKPGSLKAVNCVRGRELLISYCKEKNISFEMCGKLIAATSTEQRKRLAVLAEQGRANNISFSFLSTSEEVKEYEPACGAISGLFVKDAGIINYKEVGSALCKDIIENGGEVLLGWKVIQIISKHDGIVIRNSGEEELFGHKLLNCAGLQSDKIARLSGLTVKGSIVPFRGEYYKLNPRYHHLCRNLIYPAPDMRFPFLGIHITRMIDGEIECGPNAVLAFAREGYSRKAFDLSDTLSLLRERGFRTFARTHWRSGISEIVRSLSKGRFTEEIQRLVPDITSVGILPGGTGVRAQFITDQGKLADDFIFVSDRSSLHVINAPSPAATACLSIAESIVDKLSLL